MYSDNKILPLSTKTAIKSAVTEKKKKKKMLGQVN